MHEKELINIMVSGHSWEQVLYKIIAWEGLDPWDLDLKLLSDAFLQYIKKIEELDFKIPAKYLMVATVLLRMKSDHLHFLEMIHSYDESPEIDTAEQTEVVDVSEQRFEINPIKVPPKRMVTRKVMVNDLVNSLRKALTTQDRRDKRTIRRRKYINISEDNVTHRINNLYERINILMKKLKGDEVTFSKLLEKGDKKEMIDTFLPLIFLEHSRRVNIRQENMFDEIYIRRAMNAQKNS